MDRRILYIWLSKINGVGPVIASKLIEFFGRIAFVYEAKYDDLIKVEGIGPIIAKTIVDNKDLTKSEQIFNKCNNNEIKIVTRECSNYPKQLKIFDKAPIVLYVRGNLKEINNTVAIVGARRCTEYGKNITVELAEVLSNQNIPIISGMAKGIDGYAHTVSLHNNNYTIAVVGTGVDICYPKEHLTLMNRIIENGAIISEFEPGVSNVKSNFIKRNELIAMLSEKIIIVEATKNSGSLYTAHYGVKYGKKVYSVPGDINSKYSEGTNMLINEGIKPYLSTKSLVKAINKSEKSNKSKKLTDEEEMVLNFISNKGASIDAIKLKLDLKNIEELLLSMELKGEVKEIGGVFQRAR